MSGLWIWLLCGLLIFVGMIMGHGFATHDFQAFSSIASFGPAIMNLLVGAGISFLVSRLFYKKSGDDLKVTAKKLEDSTNRILRYLDLKDRGADVEVVMTGDDMEPGLNQKACFSDSMTVGILAPTVKVTKVVRTDGGDTQDNHE